MSRRRGRPSLPRRNDSERDTGVDLDSREESSTNAILCINGITKVMGDTHLGVDLLSLGKEEPRDKKQLKDLLIVHLDLIQHQQEVILSKDRLIQSLRTERDTLKCRLERMERRMSLLRQRGDGDSPLDKSITTISSAPSSTYTHGAVGRGSKRKCSLEPHVQNLNKRFASAEKVKEDSRHGRKPAKPVQVKSDQSQSDSRDTGDEDTSPGSKENKRPRYRRRPLFEELNIDAIDEIKGRLKPVVFQRNKPENVYRSKEMYFVVEDEEEEKPAKVEKPVEDADSAVAVPGWRWHPIPTGYSMEGTENLDDQIYLKRHQKPELEEKRRKRWDMQRMREKSLYERLQQQQCNVNSNSRDESENAVCTFLPDPDDAKYIEVCDEIPVNAFGYPLPNFGPMEFELPWFDLEKRDQSEKSKSARKKR